jgi:dynein heavy chain
MRRFVRYEVSRSQEVAKANREAKPKIGTWTVSGGVKPVKTKQDFVCGSVPKPTYPNFPRPGLGNGTAGTVHAEQVKQTVRRPSYLGAEKKKTITIYKGKAKDDAATAFNGPTHSYGVRHRPRKLGGLRESRSAPSISTTKLESIMKHRRPQPKHALPIEEDPGVHTDERSMVSGKLMGAAPPLVPPLSFPAAAHPSFLPLELFDDEEKYERLNPKDWLPQKGDAASKGKKPPAFGCSRWHYSDGSWSWQPCKVWHFDQKVDRFLIEWIHNKRRKYVPRLNLRFQQESFGEHEERVEYATGMRDSAEQRMRYHYQMTSLQDVQAIGPAVTIPAELISNILFRSNVDLRQATVSAEWAELLVCLTNEVQAGYKHSVDRMHVDTSTAFADPHGEPSLIPVPSTPSAYRRALSVMPEWGDEADIKMPLGIEPYDYEGYRSKIVRLLPGGNTNIIPALQEVHAEMLSISAMCVLCGTTAVPTPLDSYAGVQAEPAWYSQSALPLEKFKALQTNQFETTIAIIQTTSCEKVKNAILDAFDLQCDLVDRELVNKHESKAIFYKSVCVANLMRRQALEVSVMHAVADYVALFEQYGLVPVPAKLIEEMEEYVRTAPPPAKEKKKTVEEEMGLASMAAPPAEGVAEGEEDEEDEDTPPKPPPTTAKTIFDAYMLERHTDESAFVLELLHKYEKREIEDPVAALPVFQVTLTAKEGKLVYDPPLEDFETVTLGMMSSMVAGIMTLHPIDLMAVHEDMDHLPPIVPSVPALHRHSGMLASLTGRVRSALQANFISPRILVDVLSTHDHFLSIDAMEHVAKKVAANQPVAEWTREILEHQAAAVDIESRTPDSVRLNAFAVDCRAIKKALVDSARQLADMLLQSVVQHMRSEFGQIDTTCTAFLTQLNMKPESIEEYGTLNQTLEAVDREMTNIEDHIASVRTKMVCLEDCRYLLSDDDSIALWGAFGWPKQLFAACEETTNLLPFYISVFETELKDQKEGFKLELQGYVAGVDLIVVNGMDRWDDCSEIAEKIKTLRTNIDEAEEVANQINSRETILEWQETTYDQLTDLQEKITPCGKLWNLVAFWDQNFHQWMDGPFKSLDRDELSTRVDGDTKELQLMEKYFEKQKCEGPQGVALHLRHLYEDFRKYMPLIYDLRNPGLRPRHWDSLAEEMNFDSIGTQSRLTLRMLLEQGGAMQCLQQISSISEVATNEHALETSLDQMVEEWSEAKGKPQLQLVFVEWRDSKTAIIQEADDILDALEEHISKSHGMHSSPYVKPFEDRLEEWVKTLTVVQETLDEWIATQTLWQYLKPIFASDDINRQIPTIGRQFKEMDQAWSVQVQDLAQSTSVMNLSTVPDLFDKFHNWKVCLEQVVFHLNEYLDMKRAAFPRFYFLSNDELLEILSHTKDPMAVQLHLPKCFDGIARLHFSKQSPLLHIFGMMSGDGESISFLSPVVPMNTPTDGKFVELWLTQVEEAMLFSLQQQMRMAMTAYTQMPRKEWVLEWPGQVVLTVGQVFGVREVEAALASIASDEGDPQALQKHSKKQADQLEDLLKKVRGPLAAVNRMTLGALVVIEVHARDVVSSLCNSTEVDFEWQSQLRYYWDSEVTSSHYVKQVEELKKPTKAAKTGGDPILGRNLLEVRMLSTFTPYSFEYLGNSSRLVITPLTDRCYRTLLQAVHLNYGGAPEGPAGTGKTETVKDLAKAVGSKCVVFNCSDSLDYLAVGKFFTGLAGCGAWACFDEFNRIHLEVLSVIAQQVSSLQAGSAAGATRIVFEGKSIAFRRGCAVFITMNPGYSGRTELPDNLKALFRPIAMMVPDYAMIAEISMYSCGFSDSRRLAGKLTLSLSLASEQVSSMGHYDFGMRAVKSCIIAAGQLKLQRAREHEDVLVLLAIHYCNIPKFTAPDISLFCDITSDLFPGVTLPAAPEASERLKAALIEECLAHNLVPVPALLNKCDQLRTTFQIRHGVMLVGDTMSGKTTCYRMLKGASCRLSEESSDFEPVQTVVINPKAQALGKLYGDFDDVTHEWMDGVLGNSLRRMASDPSPTSKWLILDGPVDAIWIENMNTVLDDNMKLCLNSGEIIALTAPMRMLFEVENLAVASPATVSRCGMVYLTSTELGWQPLVDAWLNVNPPELQKHRGLIQELVTWLIPKALECIRTSCSEPQHTTDSWLVNSLLGLFDGLLEDFKELDQAELKKKLGKARSEELKSPASKKSSGGKKGRGKKGKSKQETTDDKPLPAAAPEIDQAQVLVEGCFVFALIWSLGATTDSAGREIFSALLRTEFRAKGNRKLLRPLPTGGQVYDYQFNVRTCKWVKWAKAVPKIDDKAEFERIVIPTVESTRNSFVLSTLVANKVPVMFIGPTGTGKTLAIKTTVGGLDKSTYVPFGLALSTQTTAEDVQAKIEGHMEKRRKGVLGPPAGHTMITFIDDLNMAPVDDYGAHPSLELLRQWMDHKGWYEHETKLTSFRKLVDISFVSSMCPTSGGQAPITQRYLRHLNVVYCCPFSDETLSAIFSNILDWGLRKFDKSIRKAKEAFVSSSIAVYNFCTANLRPTPSKPLYKFNVRDLSRVFQGILAVSPKAILSKSAFVRLWIHECQRVFADRLLDEGETAQFVAHIQEMVPTNFDIGYANVVGNAPLMYGNFVAQDGPKRLYKPILGYKELRETIDECVEDMNSTSADAFSFVPFEQAMDHIVRVARVLQFPSGHMLLVGMIGCGRQSVVRIATYLFSGIHFPVRLPKDCTLLKWREFLSDALITAGVGTTPFVVVFSESQVQHPAMLGDLCTILNRGDFEEWFSQEQQDKAIGALYKMVLRKRKGIKPSNEEVFRYFIAQCRKHIRCIFRFSGQGDALRNYLRDFPALLNCCTIDWFHSWPKQALVDVAERTIKIAANVPKDTLIDVCANVHDISAQCADRYQAEYDKKFHATPGLYLQFLAMFCANVDNKANALIAEQRRYRAGCEMLDSTEAAVHEMQNDIDALKPFLEIKCQETEELMQTVEESMKEADKTRTMVKKEEEKAQEKKSQAESIKKDCEEGLAKALPALHSAIAALKTLKKSDLDEIKSFSKPPDNIRLTLEAVCVMLGVRGKKVLDTSEEGGGKRKIDDYWDASKKLLSNPKHMMSQLENYDKDNIPTAAITKINNKYLTNPKFVPEVIRASSIACEGMCKWVRAMSLYEQVSKEIKPKREALAEAEQLLQASLAILATKQTELNAAEEATNQLKRRFDQAEQEQKSLEQQSQQCIDRKHHAVELLSRLSDEEERWSTAATQLEAAHGHIVGNTLLASGFVTYLGFFNHRYRGLIVDGWMAALMEGGIPTSDVFDLEKVAGNPLTINRWTTQGLPADHFSIQNGVVVTEGMDYKYPFMIDPQGQANRWVRSMEEESGLRIARTTDKKLADMLENVISLGFPILIENVTGPFDPLLVPILLRQTTLMPGGSGRRSILVDGASVRFNPEFRLYMTTNIANPNLSAEDSVMVSFVNFTITPDGLEDQFLSTITHVERPEDAAQKDALLKQTASYKEQLKAAEDRVLHLLSVSKGNILDDVELIQTLKESKSKSEEIGKALKMAQETEKRVNRLMELYRPLAARCSYLYFCVAKLSDIESLYQFSLKWVTDLFVNVITSKQDVKMKVGRVDIKQVKQRVPQLVQTVTETVYQNVCQSLFEKDKLLFSFLICLRVLEAANEVTTEEKRFLLTGLVAGSFTEEPNPAPEWLTKRAWGELQQLSQLPAFKGLSTAITGAPEAWKGVYESPDAMSAQLPSGFQTRVSRFQRLLLLRCLRPDKAKVPAIQNFVSEVLGRMFIEPIAFNLKKCFEESDCCKPLLFFLTPGQNPVSLVREFGQKMYQRLSAISLGQGQEARATNAFEYAHDSGTWVLLENCHLVPRWLGKLQELIDDISPERANPAFRLWLTSAPTEAFPVSLLRGSVKMVNEAPEGLRANLARSLNSFDRDMLDLCPKHPEAWRKLVFGVCFFHALVQERRKFGPLGWTTAYGFSDTDLRVSLDHMAEQLEHSAEGVVPLGSIHYVTSELNYGGRVTDERDRTLLKIILSDFVCEGIMDDEYKFSESGIYHVPEKGDGSPWDSMLKYVNKLPINDSPEAFGLHANAEFTLKVRESYALFAKAQSLQQYGEAASLSGMDDTVGATTKKILSKLLPNFDMGQVLVQYPPKYEESMNTVLANELKRYNYLLDVVRKTLKDLQQAMAGILIITPTEERVLASIFSGAVPEVWAKAAYPSQKGLMSWTEDLNTRLHFFSDWILEGPPTIFWVSGFFFTQSFITGVLQNHARREKVSIDSLKFDFDVLSELGDPEQRPSVGAYIKGLFLECCQWDHQSHVLAESSPNQMATQVPVIWLKPGTHSATLGTEDASRKGLHKYNCPVYREPSRQGKLLTTGHSTNFLMMMDMPSEHEPRHWVKRGVAMLCSLEE